MASPSPLMASPLVGNGDKDDNTVKSYAVAVAKPTELTSFKIPMRFPMDVNGELGFIFYESEMVKTVDEYKFAIVMKFMHARPFIENIRLHIVKKWDLWKYPRSTSWMIFMF